MLDWEQLGNIYIEDDFDNLLNPQQPQPGPTILIENTRNHGLGSPPRGDQPDHGPGPRNAKKQLGFRTGQGIIAVANGPEDHAGHGVGPTSAEDHPSQGSVLGTTTGTNGPNNSNGLPEIRPTWAADLVDIGSENGPVAQSREKRSQKAPSHL